MRFRHGLGHYLSISIDFMGTAQGAGGLLLKLMNTTRKYVLESEEGYHESSRIKTAQNRHHYAIARAESKESLPKPTKALKKKKRFQI